jgi:hypothetical protein
MGPFGELERYSRQILFAPVGVEGQRKLRAASVLVVGCGALGTSVLAQLARAGVGRIRFVDRDFVNVEPAAPFWSSRMPPRACPRPSPRTAPGGHQLEPEMTRVVHPVHQRRGLAEGWT